MGKRGCTTFAVFVTAHGVLCLVSMPSLPQAAPAFNYSASEPFVCGSGFQLLPLQSRPRSRQPPDLHPRKPTRIYEELYAPFSRPPHSLRTCNFPDGCLLIRIRVTFLFPAASLPPAPHSLRSRPHGTPFNLP